MKYLAFFILIIVSASFFFYVKKDNINMEPVALDRSQMCASDAMIIINYHGPKAQILWKDGSRSFYCEVREAFYESLDQIKSKRIKAFFVQDFSKLEWGSYSDKWMIAGDAYYVIDSSKDGAMGLTYVPFSELESAEQFFALYGGKLLKFNEIDSNILATSSELLKNRMIF